MLKLDQTEIDNVRAEIDKSAALLISLQNQVTITTSTEELYKLMQLIESRIERLNDLNKHHASLTLGHINSIIHSREMWAYAPGQPRRLSVPPTVPTWVQCAETIHSPIEPHNVMFAAGSYVIVRYNRERQLLLTKSIGVSASIPAAWIKRFYECLNFPVGELVRLAGEMDHGIQVSHEEDHLKYLGEVGEIVQVNLITEPEDGKGWAWGNPTIKVDWHDGEDATYHAPNDLRMKW